MYLDGDGVPVFSLLRKAAKDGDYMALHTLGIGYRDGSFGLQKGENKAVR